MARTQVTGTQATFQLANRHGGKPNGTVYDCLVSDLVNGDYLTGVRATVIATGTTTSGVRTLTVERLGFSMSVQMVAASSVRIIA